MEHSEHFWHDDAVHEQAICTMFEGDYHFGVGALINSLVANGYRGLIWVGFRGNPPPWLSKLPRRPDGLYTIGDALLYLEPLTTGSHFSQYKPWFMEAILQSGKVSKYLWYFDPDITVRCSWHFFELWIEQGVGLCCDAIPSYMPQDHPLRLQWVNLVCGAGWNNPVRLPDWYFNSGFVGLPVTYRVFLSVWIAANEIAYSTGISSSDFTTSSRDNIFYTVDQDTLNIAAMFTDVPLSTIGAEGMGFTPGGFTMFHAAGAEKSWRRSFLRTVLDGRPPSPGDQHYLQCAAGVIPLYSSIHLWHLEILRKTAGLIGRFYRRG